MFNLCIVFLRTFVVLLGGGGSWALVNPLALFKMKVSQNFKKYALDAIGMQCCSFRENLVRDRTLDKDFSR